MKKIIISSQISILILSIFVILFESGCKESVSTQLQKPQTSLMASIAPSDFLSRYDISNLVGIIVPVKEQYSIITQVTPAINRTNFDGTQSTGSANFIDGSGAPLGVRMCYFNSQFPYAADGLYSFSGTNLPIHTDGSTPDTVIVVGMDSLFGSTFSYLTYGPAPVITNIVRGQNISRDSTITVTWTGASGDFVNVNIFVWDTTGTSDTVGKGYGLGGYFNNTGSVTIRVVDPAQLKLGLADLELIKYEPKFNTLSSGKRIAVVCETKEAITVHIVN